MLPLLLSRPHGRRPTLLFVLVATDGTRDFLQKRVPILSVAVRSPGGTASFRILSESGPPSSRSNYPYLGFREDPWYCFDSYLAETSSSLNSSPVWSIARMIVSSLRAVATTATFLRPLWPATIRS